MFSGIIETTGTVSEIIEEQTNIKLRISSLISAKTYIDQSISHNGVCLTVVDKNMDSHVVQVVKESLSRSNLGQLKIGDLINLERSLSLSSRMDGHMVQGHVDCVARCWEIKDEAGSWKMRFEYPSEYDHLLVDKGSISLDGISLTVIQPDTNTFQVAIIPYTFEHTNMKNLKIGSQVNVEFDIIGKYVAKYLKKVNSGQ